MKRFNLYIALLLLVLDAIAIFAGLWLSYTLRAQGGELFAWPVEEYLKFAALVTPVWLLILASLGVYNPHEPVKGWQAARNIFIGLLSGWAVVVIGLYLWRSPESQNFPRLIIVYGFFFTLGLVWLGHLLVNVILAALYRAGVGVAKTVVIGHGETDEVAEKLRSSTSYGKQVVAVISGSYLEKLASLFAKGKVDEIFVTDASIDEKTMLKILDFAQDHNAVFTVVPSLLSVRSSNVEMASLAGVPVMLFKRSALEGWGRVFKRLLDLLLVIPAIIILSPLLILLALLVKISSPGPAIYKEKRIGQDGVEFTVGKFRSMYADWRQRFPDIKDWSTNEATDVRITKIGRILRKTNLDELPQLFSVLDGSMSLVGPRPEQPKYVQAFAEEIPDYIKRHHVKTGLTGWAQINGLRGDTSVAERVKYDLYYIENWSIWFDVRIILGTFVYVFKQLVGAK